MNRDTRITAGDVDEPRGIRRIAMNEPTGEYDGGGMITRSEGANR